MNEALLEAAKQALNAMSYGDEDTRVEAIDAARPILRCAIAQAEK